MPQYEIELGALLKVPCWEPHNRGKNWMAIIHKDPQSPGGLGRKFQPRAKGEYYYLITEEIAPGVVLEFGADYYSGGGNPHRRRVYAVVISITKTILELEEFETAAQAFKFTLPTSEEVVRTVTPEIKGGN